MKRVVGPVSLREMLKSDLRAVASAEKKTFTKNAWKLKDFSELLRPPTGMGIVAEVNDTLVGYLLGMQAADEAELLNIGVIPEARRQGVGRGLLKIWLERMHERGTRNIYLDVRISNHSAIQLYESFSFAVAGCRPHYYPDGEDSLVMKLALNSQHWREPEHDRGGRR
ncbi:MAG: ribosomal protein S18-alanine N-acetyltransferase [bacterium]